MKKIITMPAFKAGMTEAVLCSFGADEGDGVKKGGVLFEAECDKVVSEVTSDCDLTLLRYLAEEGDTLAPGDGVCEVEVSL